MSIIIFSRPVRSGKTTALMQYCEEMKNKKSVGGILMPDVGGSRKLLDIGSNEYFDIECKDPSTTTRSLIAIGNFYFFTDAFERANNIIVKAALKSDLLIIDEVGKLELEQKGFYPGIKEILDSGYHKGNISTLLLVVRENLYDQVTAFFNIAQHTMVNTTGDI